MNINDAVLRSGEKIILTLRELYSLRGYAPYRMSKFEEYDLYAKNKDFLVSDNVITFTDTSGKLMALKPDVTLSIIKNSIDTPKETKKVFYDENVYRVSKGTGSFKEIMQAGVECFGKVEKEDVYEVLHLAAESMKVLSPNAILSVSDIGVLAEIIEKLDLDSKSEKKLYGAISEKNVHEVSEVCKECANKEAVALLEKLLAVHGHPADVLKKLDEMLDKNGEYLRFYDVVKALSESDVKDILNIDFSVTDDINYYNGIVFKGFIRDIPSAVLSGGQYDRLMQKLGRKSSAVGFAVYADAFDNVKPKDESEEEDGFVNIALPKGRLGEKIYNMFAKAGFECPSILEPNRKLIFENDEKQVRYFWVKPSDVAIYVERGAADIGVAGKDILAEYEPDIYELLDLNKGKCRMAVAAPKGYTDDQSRTLRVATKFSKVAKAFYLAKGRDIDIIHLNGSIEIAPILGLSDVIVDIVETGTTLRENNLEVIDTVFPISARLIANKSAYKFKSDKIEKIKENLSKIVEVEK